MFGLFGGISPKKMQTLLKDCAHAVRTLRRTTKHQLEQDRSSLAHMLGQGRKYDLNPHAQLLYTEDNLIHALAIVERCLAELFTGVDIFMDAASKTPPAILIEPAASVIFASAKLVEDVPDLGPLSKYLVDKFKGRGMNGKTYRHAVCSESTALDQRVHPDLLYYLNPRPPHRQVLRGYMETLANEFGIPLKVLYQQSSASESASQPGSPHLCDGATPASALSFSTTHHTHSRSHSRGSHARSLSDGSIPGTAAAVPGEGCFLVSIVGGSGCGDCHGGMTAHHLQFTQNPSHGHTQSRPPKPHPPSTAINDTISAFAAAATSPIIVPETGVDPAVYNHQGISTNGSGGTEVLVPRLGKRLIIEWSPPTPPNRDIQRGVGGMSVCSGQSGASFTNGIVECSALSDSAPAGRVKVREKNLSSKRSGADLESIARWLDHYSISEKVNPSSGGAETSAAAAAEKREAGYGSTPGQSEFDRKMGNITLYVKNISHGRNRSYG